MKKVITFLLLLAPVISFSQDNSQPAIATKMGLIAELMAVKMNAEVGVTMVLSDTADLISKKYKTEILEEYNRLRVLSIPVIAQLIADISKKNSLKVYKKLDKLLTQKSVQDINLNDIGDTKLKAYIENFKSLHATLTEFYSKAYNLSHKQIGHPRFPAVGDIVGIFTAIETAVKDFNEAKGKKIDKMVVILDATKIADVKELLEGSGGKKDKKKDDEK